MIKSLIAGLLILSSIFIFVNLKSSHAQTHPKTPYENPVIDNRLLPYDLQSSYMPFEECLSFIGTSKERAIPAGIVLGDPQIIFQDLDIPFIAVWFPMTAKDVGGELVEGISEVIWSRDVIYKTQLVYKRELEGNKL